MGNDIPYALRDGNASLLEFPVDRTPRYETFPPYQSPLPEFSKELR